jgi:hypothetical protein
MPEVKNFFTGAKMQKDLDSRLVPNGDYVDALNVRVGKSEQGDLGAVENSISNEQKTTLSLGTNPECIGSYGDEFSEKIYGFVVSTDNISTVYEYDVATETAVIVLQDNRSSPDNILNFSTSNRINQSNLIIDTDNNNRFLAWTDNRNPPRFINIERAKTYGVNNFGQDEISTIKRPPNDAPEITLTSTTSGQENNIEEKFIHFAYRYQYLDGEYSALSPFSDFAFLPSTFMYNYNTNTNESMVNDFNEVEVQINTGSSLVTKIQLCFKESQSNTVYRVETFTKSEEGWFNNTDETITFTNNKIYGALDNNQLARLYDNVPLKALAQDVILNRLVYGNYTENYNLEDCNGTPIALDYTVTDVQTSIVNGTPTRTMRSNRDYEVGIAYLDDYNRQTTVLTDRNNTVYIPNSDSINQNTLRVTINHLAPCWARRYRFYLKQTQGDYDVIVPTLFYQDGIDVWIKIEGNEINKISLGEYLIVKADTTEVLPSIVKTRVLEIATQPRNFLQDDPNTPELYQEPGTYFRVEPEGYRLNEDDFTNYQTESYDTSANKHDDPISGALFSVIEPSQFYGTTLNDMTSSGTYTGTSDIRYLVEIDSVGDGTTTFDTFRWSNDGGSTFGGSNIVITPGVAQTLENGVEVTFAANIGHTTNDEWIVSAKFSTSNNLGQDENSKAYIILENVEFDVIEGGARITIDYDESGETTSRITRSYTATRRYSNLEEWFWEDNIDQDFISQGIPLTRVWFRRGTVVTGSNGSTIFTQDNSGRMVLLIRSKGTQNNDFDARVVIRGRLSIFQSEQNVIFETQPVENNADVWYEIGRTYEVNPINQLHLGYDVNDNSQDILNPAVLNLTVFNAFAWGNAFESIKIRDAFNATRMGIDTRLNGVVEQYRQNVRIADVTYSNVFDQTTNYNALNEFNLSTANFKVYDDKFGSIQRLYSRDTNLVIFQENKLHYALFQKTQIFNADGSVNISRIDDVLGETVPIAGEFGISTNPESFAFYGNNFWFTDSTNGSVIRWGGDGLTEISKYGVEDYFRDKFRDVGNLPKIGGYDPYFDQYVLTVRGSTEALSDTITYDENQKGWTSFHSFIAEEMVRVNNRFYTFKNGQLYLHNEGTTRNNFYGTNYPTSVTYIINQNPSDIKVAKTINTESNKAFEVEITSFLNDETNDITRSTIAVAEFLNKEGKFYAYVRRNEITGDLTAQNAYGVGRVQSVTGSVITLTANIASASFGVGDQLFNGTDNSLIGVITDYGTNTIIVSTTPTIPINTFLYAVKNPRIEGSEIRGYNFKVKLTDNTSTRTELYAASSEIFKSFPS